MMIEQTEPHPDRPRSRDMLRKAGRWYILACTLLVQLLLVPGLAVWAVLLRVNAELTAEQLRISVAFIVGLALVSSLLLTIGLGFLCRTANRRLGRWADNETLTSSSSEEAEAWKQVSAAPRNLGYLSLAILPLVMVLPLLGYLHFSLRLTADQLLYALMAGLVAALATTMLSVLSLERALSPAREVLLPRSFEVQLAGATGFRLRGKFVASVLILICISVLLLAPIGYHMSYVILYEPLGSEQVFEQLRTQSLVASALVLALGVISAFLISGSISSPVDNLVNVFRGVEGGDLRQRARVLASDEIGELAVYFNRMISRLEELQSNLGKQVTARTSQLEATVEVGRVASSILDPDVLIEKVTSLITDRFDYYYAAIFLLDANGAWAELKQATGEAGKILMERRHRLPIGGKSMVSSAIQTRRGIIALDVGEEPTHFDNPLLPRTRSEIALPLISASRVLGALDVQSVNAGAFDESDINTLQNMANQVAVALENARLFRETEDALRELRAADAQAFERGWSDLARGAATLSYEVSSGGDEDCELQVMEIPLFLREQRLGSITVEGKTGWTPEERDMLESLAAQTALALENARLISESQQAALREKLVAAITERIWSAPSLEAILQTAVRELGRALEVSEATIALSIEAENE